MNAGLSSQRVSLRKEVTGGKFLAVRLGLRMTRELRQSFPELDRADWFGMTQARDKILKGQAVFLDRLSEALR